MATQSAPGGAALYRRRAAASRPSATGLRNVGVALALLALLAGASRNAVGQAASVQGMVTSSSTGSPLEGVAVLLETDGRTPHGAVTDRNGFYQIGGIRPGSYILRARLLGYAPHDQPITLGADERARLSFRLELSPVEIQGIEVSPEQGAAVRDLGRQVITAADLRRVPGPAGSGDVATYLQTLPAVTTTGDRGGQLFVRGGTPAENLVLVDGIPIYQPFHILGFFSVFPEDLVSSADFYAGGFGAHYSGRTASVLDVSLRDGDPKRYRATASLSPFLAEALAEGPAGTGTAWLLSLRRSLIEETSGRLLGTTQPYTFDSQLLKVSTTTGEDQRCSALLLRTSDRGRLDPDESVSHIAWQNLLLGGRCVTQFRSGFLRLGEVGFSYSSFDNAAVSRGSSSFHSGIRRLQHDAHATGMIAAVPLYAGYRLYGEFMAADLKELFGLADSHDGLFGMDGYLETSVPLGRRGELRPGVVLTLLPRMGTEPRLRASWQPFGRSSEKLQAAFGLYRQDVVGTSDMRDVTDVFVAWMTAPDNIPLQATHASLSWEQSLGGAFRWSLEGYARHMTAIPVPAWQPLAQFQTRLVSAGGDTHGLDLRAEFSRPHVYAFVGYGYAWTRYALAQPEFFTWFGDSVQLYHPPHDRRNQVNALVSLEAAHLKASVRWQLGSGLPFTRPMGFDEGFDYAVRLWDLNGNFGSTRLVLDRPFNGRLPVMHRLDLSLERDFELRPGKLQLQVGAINIYDRRNMFYYDLFTGKRADQLPLAPYAAVTFRTK